MIDSGYHDLILAVRTTRTLDELVQVEASGLQWVKEFLPFTLPDFLRELDQQLFILIREEGICTNRRIEEALRREAPPHLRYAPFEVLVAHAKQQAERVSNPTLQEILSQLPPYC